MISGITRHGIIMGGEMPMPWYREFRTLMARSHDIPDSWESEEGVEINNAVIESNKMLGIFTEGMQRATHFVSIHKILHNEKRTVPMWAFAIMVPPALFRPGGIYQGRRGPQWRLYQDTVIASIMETLSPDHYVHGITENRVQDLEERHLKLAETLKEKHKE